MHFANTLLSALVAGAAFTVAAPIESRDAADVVAQIKEIKANTQALTAKVQEFDGNIFQSLGIIIASGQVDGAVTDTTELADESAPFTGKESGKVVNALAGLVGPTQKSLKALEAKEPIFERVLQKWLVKLNLEDLAKDQDALIAALVAKVTKPNKPLVKLGAKAVKKAFDEAIEVYS